MATTFSTEAGYVAVLVAIVFFGSFGAPLKLRKFRRMNQDPMIMTWYMGIGIFLSCWSVLVFDKFVFSFYGLAGSLLWFPGSIFSIHAIRILGLSVAQGLWSGLIMIVSFLWGTLYFGDTLRSLFLALLGLILLVTGSTTMGMVKTTDRMEMEEKNGTEKEKTDVEIEMVSVVLDHNSAIVGKKDSLDIVIPPMQPVQTEEERIESQNTESRVVENDSDNVDDEDDECCSSPPGKDVESCNRTGVHVLPHKSGQKAATESSQNDFRKKIPGILCVCGIGLFGGSMMVPARMDPLHSIAYIISFAMGVIVLTSSACIIHYLIKKTKPKFNFKEVAPIGIFVGIIWNIGNIASTIASMSPLGLTIGYPLTQTALLVAGLWGMIVFKEIVSLKRITAFFSSAFVLLLGAVVLALFA